MSLAAGKPIFKQGYIQLQKDMLTLEVDSFEEAAEHIAELIITLVKSANVQSGITVSTTGTATSQTGITTSQGNLL